MEKVPSLLHVTQDRWWLGERITHIASVAYYKVYDGAVVVAAVACLFALVPF